MFLVDRLSIRLNMLKLQLNNCINGGQGFKISISRIALMQGQQRIHPEVIVIAFANRRLLLVESQHLLVLMIGELDN